MNHSVMMCPECGEELMVVDITEEGEDVFGCKECDYKENQEIEKIFLLRDGAMFKERTAKTWRTNNEPLLETHT